jgi:acetyl-CoA carboxylase carboxyl transferase subunit alpha
MWNDAGKKALEAEALRVSAPEVLELGCVDAIIPEPPRGIHTDRAAGSGLLGTVLKKYLNELRAMPIDALVAARQQKFRNVAQFYTQS